MIIAVAFSGCAQQQQENNGQTGLGGNNPALNNNNGTALPNTDNGTLPAGQTSSGNSGTPVPSEEDDSSTQGIDDAINELDQID